MADVQPGQVWEDKDARPAGRRLVVLSVHPRVINNPAYARLRNVETNRESGIQLRRLVTRYILVEGSLDTQAVIEPILTSTYGEGSMVTSLAKHLAEKIDGGEFDSRGREYWIMRICWDWFAGGSTAEGVARKIEAALAPMTQEENG